MPDLTVEKDSNSINHTSIPINDYKLKHKHLRNDHSDKLKQYKIDLSYNNHATDDDDDLTNNELDLTINELDLNNDEDDLSNNELDLTINEVDLNNDEDDLSNNEDNLSNNEDNLRNNEQEKEFEEKLDNIDIEMVVPSGVIEMPKQTINSPQRFSFLSKLLFFCKSKKSKKISKRYLKISELFKFADKFDIFLMIIGTISVIISGALFPILFFFYRRVTNSLVNFEKIQTNATNIISTNLSECFIVPNNNSDYDSPSQTVEKIVKYYVILGFVSIILYCIAWSSWIISAERQVRRIRYNLFRNILRQEIGWFDIHKAGELSTRLNDDLDKIKNGINEKVPDFIAILTRIISIVIYSLVIGWKLTLVFLSISPIIIILFNETVKIIIKYTIKEIQAFSTAGSIVQEVIYNIRTVTSFHGQSKEEERFGKHLLTVEKIGVKKGLYMGICQGLLQIFTFFAFTLTFWYGPQLVRTECTNYTAGTVIVVFTSCMMATRNATQLIPNFQNFGEALGSGGFVFDIIERKTDIDATSDEGDKPQTINGDIQFENVTFNYPARQETSILNKLSLKIPSGKTVALVGASGCGKSTTIQLIQRFYDPDQGRVLLDGKDIKTLNVAWLRSHIGIVSQEPVLFTGSIEENIRFGKQNATDEEIQNAAKMANAHDFIMELPENYKTTSGDKLSGGQKQRVAIARALISNPKILLLDEATSALDNTSERIVQDALDKAKEGRTTIVIAHRLSTIRNADLIIGLERGQVIEYGTHNDLMKQKGLYYELVTTQTEKEKEKEEEDESDSDKEDEDENEIEKEPIRRKSINRRLSKQSSVSSFDTNDDKDNNQTISDDPSKKKKTFRIPFIFKILKLNAPEWYWILLGSICSIICGATQPLFALFFSNVYGLFAEPDLEKQKNLTNIYAGVIFAIGFVEGLSSFLSTFGFAKSGEALTMRMRKLTFSAMLRQEMTYFDEESNSVGALVTRLSSDASSLKGMTGVRIGVILQGLSAAVTALAIAFSSSWKLSLIVLCFVPIMMLAGKIQGQRQSKAGQSKDKDSFAEQGGQYATQAIEHIRTVVALHQEEHFINLYEDAFNQEFKKRMFNLHYVSIGPAIANSAIYFLHCATFSYGSKLVERGEMKYNHVIRVFAVITFAMLALGRSMGMLSGFSKAKIAALRIMKLNKRQSQINPHDESGIILKDVIGNIEFIDVHFRYPNRPTLRILKDFSLKCSTNETTALVGPSGSGKSTIISLLQRFYDPLKGKILLDGHDIKVLNIQWLRSIMGLVQQEPVLFDLSIRDNIAYGDNTRQITQHEIETAARMANIHELIISLPQGYETLCGAKGSQLSGGQKQRIAIARALIRSPKILLLDEATSALDNKSEKVVQTALDNARIGRTCLTIAHRLTTIQNSEKIAVINRGKMKEEGTHDQLLALRGTYAKLALTQQRSN